jgi:hypothetical protein
MEMNVRSFLLIFIKLINDSEKKAHGPIDRPLKSI